MRLTSRGRERLTPLLLSLMVLVLLAVLLAATTVTGGCARSATTAPADTSLEKLGGGELTARVVLSGSDLGLAFGSVPQVTSPAAVLISLDGGRTLYERNAYKRMRMASTTKIMTAVLVLEKLDTKEPVKVSARAASTYEPKYWVRAGDILTVDELLYALLVRSANAAAVALAEACSGSVETFVAEMNRKAGELGMRDTHFANPHGLDDDAHYSTAADMAVLGRYAMQNERFRQYVSTRSYELDLPGRSPLLLTNTNKLLHEYPWVTGVKTGSTPKAEQCLVATGKRNEVEVLSVVLGQPVSDVCFEESRKLLEYGLAQRRRVVLLAKGAVVAEATLPYRFDETLKLVATDGVALEVGAQEQIEVDFTVPSSLALPVRAGEVCGEIRVKVDGQLLKTVPLAATVSAGVPTLAAKLRYGFASIGRWVSGIF